MNDFGVTSYQFVTGKVFFTPHGGKTISFDDDAKGAKTVDFLAADDRRKKRRGRNRSAKEIGKNRMKLNPRISEVSINCSGGQALRAGELGILITETPL